MPTFCLVYKDIKLESIKPSFLQKIFFSYIPEIQILRYIHLNLLFNKLVFNSLVSTYSNWSFLILDAHKKRVKALN
jgi:hypothetical protein